MLKKKDCCVELTDGLPTVEFDGIEDFERYLSGSADEASVEYVYVPFDNVSKDFFKETGRVQAIWKCRALEVVLSLDYAVYDDKHGLPLDWERDDHFWRGDYLLTFREVSCGCIFETNIKELRISSYETVGPIIYDIVFDYSTLEKIAGKILEDVKYNESL